MKWLVFGLGCWLALASSGCTPFTAVRTTDALSDRFTRRPPSEVAGAYPAWRMIGIKNDPAAPCPEIPSWKVRQLFELGRRTSACRNGSSEPTKGVDEVAQQLDRFCLYERDGSKAKALPPLVTLGLTSLEPDAVAMTAAVQIPGASGPFGRRIASPLETYFADQTGSTPVEDTVDGNPPPVRLAFVDSEPDAETLRQGERTLEHGHFLELIGRELGGSAVAITSKLALPIVDFDAADPERSPRDWTKGGKVGSFSDLARAIYREVAAWNPQRQHLVLNLSVGWDGEKFGGLTEKRVCDLPAGPQAVYLALEYAARQGALIFAASGNAQTGPHASRGPLLPAAWARGNIQESACDKGLEFPLLYAVGGVQWDGKPLTNARKGSIPELVAYADHVVLNDPDKGGPTATYTGSSVATAVVSSIAARLWYHYQSHQENARDIVDFLLRRGEDLHYLADFTYRDKGPATVKQILAFPNEHLKPGRPVLADLFPETGTPVKTAEIPDGCRGTTSGNPSQACPAERYDDFWSKAWILPQPEDDPCPNCAMRPPQSQFFSAGTSGSPDGVLHVEISSDWTNAGSTGVHLQSATLEVELADSSRKDYFITLPGDLSTPFDVSVPASSDAVRATLSWLVVKGTEISSINTPVLITG